jgi:hypothetical protein
MRNPKWLLTVAATSVILPACASKDSDAVPPPTGMTATPLDGSAPGVIAEPMDGGGDAGRFDAGYADAGVIAPPLDGGADSGDAGDGG